MVVDQVRQRHGRARALLLVLSRHPLDPSVEAMPFRMVESLAHLRLVEEAIDENRSYFREGDIVSDEKRAQVLEHGQPSRMRARALWEWHPRSACGHGAEPT